MTQIMLRKLISARHKCSVHHPSGLVQTGFSATPSGIAQLANISRLLSNIRNMSDPNTLSAFKRMLVSVFFEVSSA
jgi:hypothetical protein